jgi:hypothetical protein
MQRVLPGCGQNLAEPFKKHFELIGLNEMQHRSPENNIKKKILL